MGNEAATIAAMAGCLERQRAAFMAELPVSAATRRDRIKRCIALLVDNADALCDTLSEDFGHRSREMSMMADIAGSIRGLRYALHNLDRFMKPEKRRLDFPLNLLGARAWVEYQPKGVVGVIAPWNFPVQLTFAPIASAFAAGNRVMAKASEFTPATSALMAELASSLFDETELAFFNGAADVGQAFARLPFDHLIFTGATGVGKHILHAAADNLTPVTLELGGKSPTIVGRSADVARATQRVAIGKMLNAGQICLAPDYLLVPREQEEAVVAGLKSAVALMYPTLLENPDYGSVVNARHRDRLQSYIDDARTKGADVIEVNPANEDFAASNGNKMPLYIVRNPSDDMKVMQEEIFGPVLPVKTYERIDEAIAYVNAHDRPLGLYYFGEDDAERRQLLDRTISGGVTLNDVIFHTSMEDLPFGGVGPSGMGAYHGVEGFRTFSHAKAVFRQPKINVAKLAGIMPPYGKASRASIARDVRK